MSTLNHIFAILTVISTTASIAKAYELNSDREIGVSAYATNSCEQEQGLPRCSEGFHSHCCPDAESLPVHCSGNFYAVQTADGHWTCARIPGSSQ